MRMHIAVIGAGSWGTAVSWLLGGKHDDVRLWAHEEEVAAGINEAHRNPMYLKDVVLPGSVKASGDLEYVMHGAQAVVVVVPSHLVRSVAVRFEPFLDPATPVVSLAKGIEAGTLMRMTQVLEDVVGGRSRLAALSGPNHAEEVGKGIPSATVIASYEEPVGRRLREIFATRVFRPYTNPDVVGVELGGATKNVVAVAAGIADGLGYGDNSKASLITRGLAEMTRLGTHLGAQPLTFMGLSGMGDLIATATSRHSRNRGLGEEIANGGSVKSYEDKTHMIAEGATSAVTVDELGAKFGIELPITHLARQILAGEVPATAAEEILMGRAETDELHGMGLVEDDGAATP
jgi:glycerol-3-phosphate dehydrogenase (NAD(P)+)